jgi:hypothetical protein
VLRNDGPRLIRGPHPFDRRGACQEVWRKGARSPGAPPRPASPAALPANSRRRKAGNATTFSTSSGQKASIRGR